MTPLEYLQARRELARAAVAARGEALLEDADDARRLGGAAVARRPGLALGAGFVAGFLAGRFHPRPHVRSVGRYAVRAASLGRWLLS